MKTETVNLNSQCTVVLTASGMKHYREFHEKLFETMSNAYRDKLMSTLLQSNTIKEPLWWLMSVFGDLMYAGLPPLMFEGNKIQIEVEE